MIKIKDNTIDFETVLTKEDLGKLTKEEIDFIDIESSYHSNYLRTTYASFRLHDFLHKRARELAFLGFKYQSQSDIFKELLAAKIIFQDDEKFIRALLAKNITYLQLYSYSKMISGTKKLMTLSKKIDDESITIANKKLNNLCAYIKIYFGFKDYNLILAKINEIVVFKKDLYKKLENEHLKQKKR